MHLRLAWRPARGLELTARVNNVFDKRYASYGAVGDTVFDASGAYTGVGANALFIAPGAPRSFFVGARLNF